MMFYPPPKRCLTTPSKRFKDFSHLFRKCKICGKVMSRRRKLLRGIVRRELREFVYHGCVFRVGMNTPFAAKVHAAALLLAKYYDRWCRTIFDVVNSSLQLPFNHAHVEPSQLICRSSTYSEASV
ncbi:hypothetical protein TNCV_1635101 [Trichonephila clavipes]|nr:hypothetical protein TNCV_1635101 [Trichonephila clavipes]